MINKYGSSLVKPSMKYSRDSCSWLHLSGLILLIIISSFIAPIKGASTDLWMKSDLVVVGSINSLKTINGEEMGVLTVSRVMKSENTSLYFKGVTPITEIFVKNSALQRTEQMLFLEKIHEKNYRVLKAEALSKNPNIKVRNTGYLAMIAVALLITWKMGEEG